MIQPPLFDDVSIRSARLEQLLACEALLMGLLRLHVVKILARAIAGGCRDWDDVVSFATVARNGSRRSRRRLVSFVRRTSTSVAEGP